MRLGPRISDRMTREPRCCRRHGAQCKVHRPRRAGSSGRSNERYGISCVSAAALLCALLSTGASAMPVAPTGTSTYASRDVIADFGREETADFGSRYHVIHGGGRRGENPGTALWNIAVPAHSVLTYTVRARIKTTDIRSVRGAGLFVRPRADAGFLSSDDNVETIITGENDWRPITLVCKPPSGATGFGLFLIVRDVGEAWFDSLEIEDNFEEMFPGKGTTAEERDRFFAEQFARQEAEQKRRRLESEERAIADATRVYGKQAVSYVTGFAPSTVHIFQEGVPFDIAVADDVTIRAVRGEREAVQLVILPVERDLEDVRVSVSGIDGAAVNPVGSVYISGYASSPYPREPLYVGWWPDPLVNNFAFDVPKRWAQAVWISVKVPRDARPGKYEGEIAVAPANAAARKLALTVEVVDCLLPKDWIFRNLLCFDDGRYGPLVYGGAEAWEDVREKFIEFLLDRRINLSGLAGVSQKRYTVDDMIRFADRGANVLFAYQYWWGKKMAPDEEAPPKVREWMERLEPLGYADRVVVYGWDEALPEKYPHILAAANLLEREFPGLPLLSAGTDHTIGAQSDLDEAPNFIFCPLQFKWDQALVDAAKARGTREVWVYNITWTIDQHAIRSRLIPWQCYQGGARGFLIWSMNRWKIGPNQYPKTVPDGQIRLKDWNAEMDGSYMHSTAMYVYPGENGPISSMRLENFADGCEDYDLLAVAEQQGRRVAIGDEFIIDGLRYSTDPAVFAEYRAKLLEAVDGAHRAEK